MDKIKKIEKNNILDSPLLFQHSITSQMTTCQKHLTCKMLASKGASYGTAVVPCMPYRNKITGGYTWIMGVGLEVGGQYAGQYNLCAGKGEQTDVNSNGEFCWLKTALRELDEEFTIKVSFGCEFEKLFRGSNGRIRVFLYQTTPIFIPVLPTGHSRRPIKAKMLVNLANPKLPRCRKEMSDFEFITLEHGSQIDGKQIQISTFANGVRRMIDIKKF